MKDPALAKPDQNTIQSFFNSITDRYDFLNSLLSLGLDGYWRRKTARSSVSGYERAILDLGVGTGKSLSAFLKAHPFERAVGFDFSEEMLKVAAQNLKDKAELVSGDFHKLPFSDEAFDIVTGSFILRSVQHMNRFMSENYRVLKRGGKLVFLELTRPTQSWVRRFLFEPYLKIYVPLMGRFFSKHDQAYQFLSQSILAFPEPSALVGALRSVGFRSISVKPLTFGVVTIITAVKDI